MLWTYSKTGSIPLALALENVNHHEIHEIEDVDIFLTKET